MVSFLVLSLLALTALSAAATVIAADALTARLTGGRAAAVATRGHAFVPARS